MKKNVLALLAVLVMAGAAFAAEAVPSGATFYTLRLVPGMDLVQEVRKFADENHLQAASVVSAVGSLSEANIRYADRSDGTLLKGVFEVIYFGGTIDAKKQHLHISIADENGKMLGGHLMKSGSVTRTTMEIVLMELNDVVYTREKCPLSTYNELVVRRRENASAPK